MGDIRRASDPSIVIRALPAALEVIAPPVSVAQGRNRKRQSDYHLDALNGEQLLLPPDAAVAHELPICANHPAAGDNNGQSIQSINPPHSSYRRRSPDRGGQFTVATGLPVRNLTKRTPKRSAEGPFPGPRLEE